MALQNIEVPLYYSLGEDKEHKLIVSGFAGRIQLTIKEGKTKETNIECYFDDLQRAWDAVKRY